MRVERMGGRLDAGFLISRFFDDRFALSDQGPLSYYLDTLLPHALLSPKAKDRLPFTSEAACGFYSSAAQR